MKQTTATAIEPKAKPFGLKTQIRTILGYPLGPYLSALYLLIVLSLLTACSEGQQSKDEKKSRSTKAIPVEVTEIKRGPKIGRAHV